MSAYAFQGGRCPHGRISLSTGNFGQQKIRGAKRSSEDAADAPELRLVAVMGMIVKNAARDAGKLEIFAHDRQRQPVSDRQDRRGWPDFKVDLIDLAGREFLDLVVGVERAKLGAASRIELDNAAIRIQALSASRAG